MTRQCIFLVVVLFICHILHLNVSLKIRNRVVVIGGGAAGYFGALQCAKTLADNNRMADSEVIVLEESKSPLSKILISGGGRCNVMHNPLKGSNTIARKGYPRGSKELLSPYNKHFSPAATWMWFESKGLELKIESDGRVFPTSDRASSVIKVLEQEAARYAFLRVVCGAKVTQLRHDKERGQFALRWRQMNATEAEDEQELWCDRVICATGSSRAGYLLAQGLGHKVEPPVPSLFSLRLADANLTSLAGVSVPRVKVKLVGPQPQPPHHLNTSFSQLGPLLVTHSGLSGPAILRLSAFAAKSLALLRYKVELQVNWLGEMKEEALLDYFLRVKEATPTRWLGRGFPVLSSAWLAKLLDMRGEEDGTRESEDEDAGEDQPDQRLLSRRLWGYLLGRAAIAADTTWAGVTLAALRRLAQELCRCRLSVVGRGVNKDEFVTCGGVSLAQIDMNRMESKILPGLHFAGELLDIDGITGGYNFQAAWTTGYIAGTAAAQSLCAAARQ